MLGIVWLMPTNIRNCFAHTGIFPEDQEEALQRNPPLMDEHQCEVKQLVAQLGQVGKASKVPVINAEEFLGFNCFIEMNWNDYSNIRKLIIKVK